MSGQYSQETKDKIKAFEDADSLYKEEWEKFEQANATYLEYLDRLREDRNAKLDDARRLLRQETEMFDDNRCVNKIGPFVVQKKWSEFYMPEKTVALLRDHGLLDSALSSKVVSIKVETERFEVLNKFLIEAGVAQDFEVAEDGCPAHTAVQGPKPVPPFGAELKKE